MAALSVCAGLAGAGASYALRMKQLNDEISRRNHNVRELNKLRMVRATSQGNSAYASNTNIDAFLESARVEMAKTLQEKVAVSDALILEMESDIAGYSFARDGALTMVAFVAAMIVVIVKARALAKREERLAAISKKAEEPPKPRERRPVEQMEDIGHALTCIPAPAATPKEAEAPEGKFPRPAYFDELFTDLKRSLREEMRSPGSTEAAEAFLCVMGRREAEDLIHWPETIELHISTHRVRLGEFFKEKGIDPRHLFARLGPEVTDLF